MGAGAAPGARGSRGARRRRRRAAVAVLLGGLLAATAHTTAPSAAARGAGTAAPWSSPLLPAGPGWVLPDQPVHVAYVGSTKPMHAVWVYPAFGRAVSLQRREPDGSWTELQSLRTQRDTVYGMVEPVLPPADSAGRVTYRFVAEATAWDPEAVSAKVVVDHQEWSTYEEERTAAGSALAEHCPGSTVSIGLPMEDDLMGVAYPWTREIGIAPGLPDDELVATALHECAHLLQWEVPVDPMALEKRLRKIHGPLPEWEHDEEVLPGTEQNADCVAELLGTPVPGTYTSSCEGRAGAAAAAVLAGRVP